MLLLTVSSNGNSCKTLDASCGLVLDPGRRSLASVTTTTSTAGDEGGGFGLSGGGRGRAVADKDTDNAGGVQTLSTPLLWGGEFGAAEVSQCRLTPC